MSREVVLHGEVPRSAPNTTSSVSVGSECHRLENRSLRAVRTELSHLLPKSALVLKQCI